MFSKANKVFLFPKPYQVFLLPKPKQAATENWEETETNINITV